MKYLNARQFSEKWGITERRIIKLCKDGRIDGAFKNGRQWLIPENTLKPSDKRTNISKYINTKKRVLITKKETVLNNDVKASMKTAIKKVEKAQTKDDAVKASAEAIKRIDNAASKGVIKANTRDRYKTRVNKIVNSK